MTPLRLYSFLGQVARPHYEAVGGLVARAAGCDPLPLEEPSLAQLDAVIATPGPALVFLCGLPYVRLRDANAPIEPIAAAVPRGDTAPQYFADMVVRQRVRRRHGGRPRRRPHRLQRARLALGLRAAIRRADGSRARRPALRRRDRDGQPPPLARAAPPRRARRGRDRLHAPRPRGPRGPRDRRAPRARASRPGPDPARRARQRRRVPRGPADRRPSSTSTSTSWAEQPSTSASSTASSRPPTEPTTRSARWTAPCDRSQTGDTRPAETRKHPAVAAATTGHVPRVDSSSRHRDQQTRRPTCGVGSSARRCVHEKGVLPAVGASEVGSAGTENPRNPGPEEPRTRGNPEVPQVQKYRYPPNRLNPSGR